MASSSSFSIHTPFNVSGGRNAHHMHDAHTMRNFDIYVINLDKHKDRLEDMTNKLSPNKFIRIAGVNGKEIDLNEYDEILTYFAKNYAPLLLIGCSLSHLKATKQFYDTSTNDYAVILEDDAIPTNANYMEEIEIAIQNAPSDWEMIKLDYWPVRHKGDFSRYWTGLLTGYIVNKKGCEKILKTKIIHSYDVQLNYTDVIVYNNPTIVFHQNWLNENNISINRSPPSYNPLYYLHPALKYQLIRISKYEITCADSLLIFIGLIALIISMIFMHRILLIKMFRKLQKNWLLQIINSIRETTIFT